ncbi:saccharopine dehydrogenase C-terminal domain-containing protein [Tateyamaria sp. ANG-S1]|uniref:saccharopine dehydrogenase family protein n=1 Tax=Tateyamaria sp. ANG-S1 TaxID=1577905 RepID=UPI00057D400D|nr:saccharopine dehydrogenase C-terminal domain-containing protein [Tateyamaria sp. ANG-S1]KIC50009.1 saccharopine dehydrogenase [Tateyamaria sp. ANG-S1]
MTIHWCGTGLSAIPGLKRLIELGYPVTVWNRTVSKAQDAIGSYTQDIRAFDLAALKAALQPGDTVVSMLPGDWHVPFAQAAIDAHAHFVSSSYIAPEMRALDQKAEEAGVALVNEVGLDPGIDHLMAHHLVAAYRNSGAYDDTNRISFKSYCGGVPKHANAFRYKFSWAPVGVLKALKSPSKSIRAGEELTVSKPWDAITSYSAPLPQPETFEVYPNRDSLPFMAEYGFDPKWEVHEFVRGTLRLNGWADAWKDVFAEIETNPSDARLAEMSDAMLAENSYAESEPDRVILCVDLKAENATGTAWHQTYVMDAWGDARGTAMARLVSIPVSLAVQAAQGGAIKPGVHAAPSDGHLVANWMDEISRLAQHLAIVDHTA